MHRIPAAPAAVLLTLALMQAGCGGARTVTMPPGGGSSNGGGGTPGSVQFALAAVVVGESATQLSLVVRRAGGASGAVSVRVRSVAGSATAPDDFTVVDSVLSWNSGDSADRSIVVAMRDDSLFEGDESFELALSPVSGGVALGANSRIGITVEEDDFPPPPVSQPLGYYTDMVSAPVGAYVTAYGSGFGGSGTVSLGGANQQVFSYSDTKVVFTVSGAGGVLMVGDKNLGQLRVHAGRVFSVTPDTIRSTVSGWQAGDVYYLRGGTYSGVLKSDNWNFSSNFDIIQSPATADRPIAIVGYPGEVATLTGTGSRPNFIFANSGGGAKASNMVVANLNLITPNTCVDSGASISTENGGGENLRIVGNICTISATGNTMTGMMNFGGNGSTILGNTFVDNPARQIINNNHALYVHAGADNVTVGYNVFRNLRMGHVVQIHQDGVARDYMNIRVHDNLLEAVNNNEMRGITVSNVSSASTVSIERNTLRNVGQDFSGISVYGGIVAIHDNRFYAVRAANISLNGMPLGSSGTQMRTVIATGNRFETINGYAAVQAVGGASMNNITLAGNSYCGIPPSPQDSNPLANCN